MAQAVGHRAGGVWSGGAAFLGAVHDRALAAQRGALFPWMPVALATGIGLYFAAPAEPAVRVLALAGLGAAVLALGAALLGAARAPLPLAMALVLAGFALAGVRAISVAALVLERPAYGAVEGRIRAIDRSQSDRLRLTLDEVWIERVPAGATPERVRVTLHASQEYLSPRPGMRVAMTAWLLPPNGPAEPGGFDFQRHAWFLGIGANGYTRLPVVLVEEPPPAALAERIARLRDGISRAIRTRMPERSGPFAAAILVGDRAHLDTGMVTDLRASNLAHLLAISGLHMGLLTGLSFMLVRGSLALVPPLALRLPLRRIAAVAALVVASIYLLLSGGNVATQRAYVMALVFLGAILLGRRALSLRSVAVAALVVLVARPESLVEPGFQMSFAATTALVAVFAVLRERFPASSGRGVMRGTLALVVSSLTAGLATAPVAAFHFNQFASYGLIANLLSVPVMGLVIMPGALLALALAPLGLASFGLAISGFGIEWVLEVAARVASLEGAVRPVAQPGSPWLPSMAFAGLFWCLWQGSGRLLGPLLLAVTLLAGQGGGARPELLVSPEARLVGLMTPEGRVLSRPRGEGFSAGVWLRGDGDPASQQQAAARAGFEPVPEGRAFAFSGGRGLLLEHADTDPGALLDLCVRYRLIIAPALQAPPTPCRVIDARLLAGGAVAVRQRGGELRVIDTATAQGRRLWTRDPAGW